MGDDDKLRHDIHMLGDMLGDVVGRLAGPASLALVEEIRQLARSRRKGSADAGAQLHARVATLTEDQIRVVTQAFTIFFDLANLAEDRHRARTLRTREQARQPKPRSESIGDAVQKLHDAGVPPETLQELLDRLDVEMVFTAHPTEAKRRSMRAKITKMRGYLTQLDDELLTREKDRVLARLRGELSSLWQSDFVRPRAPTVSEEVQRGLSFAPTLWQVAPQIHQDMLDALDNVYKGHDFRVARFLRFGSWMGGDRDGHPHVTVDVTADTLYWLRRTAVAHHLDQATRLEHSLTISNLRADVDSALTTAVADALARWPDLVARVERHSPYETFRRWLTVVEWRLERSTPTAPGEAPPAGGYQKAAELEADVLLTVESLKRCQGDGAVDPDLSDWLLQTRTFGFHLARLDVRQESRTYHEVLADLFKAAGVHATYDQLDEAGRQKVLSETLGRRVAPPWDALQPMTRETLSLYRLLDKTIRLYGPDPLGGHVISMTHAPGDLLAVLWLQHWAAAEAKAEDPAAEAVAVLPIVPLFETIADLHHGPDILDAILSQPTYRKHVDKTGSVQTVMVGYSDSTKDGGYLAAQWALYHGQAELAKVAAKHNVRLVVFHGRGGSLGRGGGPAARGILSLPPEAVGGAVRMTEQGEVLAERYDDPRIAYRHLEQVTWATLLVSGRPTPAPNPAWIASMAGMAETSFKAYRNLVEQPGFLPFFGYATPIEAIEKMPIGSRPARRRGERTLKDLRA
ncbi:MAG: phosphoenolpyruvate carboxylase, partial [Planctomycetia bacterium]